LGFPPPPLFFACMLTRSKQASPDCRGTSKAVLFPLKQHQCRDQAFCFQLVVHADCLRHGHHLVLRSLQDTEVCQLSAQSKCRSRRARLGAHLSILTLHRGQPMTSLMSLPVTRFVALPIKLLAFFSICCDVLDGYAPPLVVEGIKSRLITR